MNPLQYIKLAMLAVGSLFGLFIGGQDLVTSLSEGAPSVFTVAEFANRYDGERYLEVHGRLAIEHQAVVPSRSGRSGRDVYTPVVEPDWDPARPVWIVAVGVPDGAAGGSVADGVIRGTRRRGALAPIRDELSSLQLADDFVAINTGTEPGGLAGGLFFFGLMLLGAAIAWSVILADLAKARRRVAR